MSDEVVTFVTALYLPSGPTFKKIDKYFELFERLASTGILLVVFLDSRLRERGEMLRYRFPNIMRIEYGVLDRGSTVRDVILPSVRNYEKDTADYMYIQLTKLRLMSQVALEMDDGGKIAWIDFGIYHMFRDYSQCDKLLRRIAVGDFSCDRIISPGYTNFVDDWYFENICWKHCGSLLIGEADLFIKAYMRQTELVSENMPRLTWEVNYWAMMDEHFEIYKANHNDLILERLVDIKGLH